MSLLGLLSRLRALDVRLWADGGQLRYSAAPGVLNGELLRQLAERKVEVLRFLAESERSLRGAPQAIPRAARDGGLELSFAQERLWFLNRMEPDKALHNLPSVLRLEGPLDGAALARGLLEVVRRHEVLRTTYELRDGRPVQVVHPPPRSLMALVDLRLLPPSRREAEARRLALEDAVLRFDLACDLPIRAKLLRLDEREHRLVLTFHHVATDGESAGVLKRDLTLAYNALAAGARPVFSELPVQYADFAAWQRERLRGEALRNGLAYWRGKLQAPLPVLSLPGDRPRVPVRTFGGGSLLSVLPLELGDGLRGLGRSEEATLFMTLLASWKALLWRYTRQDDLVVGTSVAYRDRPETADLIGNFTNELALRSSLGGEPTFRQLLRRVRDVAREAHEYKDVPFELIVTELANVRDMSRTPLFETSFDLRDETRLPLELTAVRTEVEVLASGAVELDLMIAVAATPRELVVEVGYSTDLLDAATVSRLTAQLQRLLRGVLDHPDLPISQLPLLSASERGQALAAWAAAHAEDGVGQPPQEAFEAYADAVALLTAGGALGAAALRRLGDRSAAPAPRSTEVRPPFLAPRTPVEELVAEIWCQILGVERVGVLDNFFSLGGHSLMAAQVISRVRTLGVDLPLRSLFEEPTVEAMAARIDAAFRAGATAALHPLSVAPRGAELPPSFGQQRLWFLQQLYPDSVAYHVNSVMALHGGLDVAALHGALAEIVRRHEALRTNFIVREGQPKVVIAPFDRLDLPLVDLSALGAAARAAEARRLMAEEARRPFSLRHDRLLRARLLRLAGDEHVLLLVLHHIVSDGWSLAVLTREATTAYAALRAGRAPSLPELPIQYPDYAVWQRAWLTGEVLEQQVAYWRGKLAGAPESLELPADRPRPSLPAYRGSRHRAVFSRSLLEGLRELGRREGVTLFMTLLAAFQTLLARHSGQEEVVVGTPIANRNRPELEPLIGLFANTLALRARVSGETAFRRLLRAVRETCLEAYAHQDLPFEKLVEELRPERSMSHAPLFQALFGLQNAPMPDLVFAGVRAEPVTTDSPAAKFDLNLQLAEAGEDLLGSFEYSADLFDGGTVERWAGHFETLLRAILADPGRPVQDLSVLGERERGLVLYEWNRTDVEYDRETTIHRLVERQAAERPDAVALDDGEARVTYGELDARADRLARRLLHLGVAPGARVGICMRRTADLVVGLLAILKTGAAYVPLDPAYPGERLAFMLRDSGVAVLVTEAALAERLPPPSLATVLMDADLPPLPPLLPLPTVTAAATAYVIYTSGSTGRPKGVVGAHRPVINLIEWVCRELQLGPGDTTLFVTSPSFDLSVFDLFGTLAAGGCVRIAGDDVVRDPRRLWRILREEPVTFWDSAPAALQQLASFFSEPAGEGRALRLAFLSGDWIPVGLPDRLRAAFPNVAVIGLGGPTETTVWSNYFRVGAVSPEWASIPYGRPIQNARHYVLDRRLEPCPIGIPGALYTGGECLAAGYLNRPELTAARFVPDPFVPLPGARMYDTGDRVRHRPDGNLVFLGRGDHQIKVRGFRVELSEVVAALCESPDVDRAVVRLHEYASEDRRLVAYVVPKGGRELSRTGLRGFLMGRLPVYMVPSAFVRLDALPLTPNGKVDYRGLPPPDAAEEPEGPWEEPRTGTERTLAAIWADILRIERVGRHDGFFELGGHSLLAVEVVARAERAGLRLAPQHLFQYPTLAELAAFCEGQGSPSAPESSHGARDDLELQVGQIWEECLGIQPIGIREDLFALGGSQDQLVSILGEIEARFGRELSAADLLPAPTIERMASRLRREGVRAAGWSPLVVLKPRGAKRPLFCVHSGTGSVLPYRHLIGCLGADRPVFGLQLPDLYQEQDGYADITAIASRHVDTLRRRQPWGPYLLAGHSGGGLVAYEVSRQLHEAGERTALLAVLDNPAPHLCAEAVGLPSVFVVMTNHLSRFVGDRHLVSEDDLRDLPEEEKLRFLLDRLKGHDLAPADAGLDWGRGFVQVQRMITRGVQAYGRQEAARPRTALPIPIALFRTREATEAWQDPAFEWDGYTSEGVRIFDIGGDHVSMLTQPAVGELAVLLDRCLDEADGKPAARPTVPEGSGAPRE